jgi:hypothetical protein
MDGEAVRMMSDEAVATAMRIGAETRKEEEGEKGSGIYTPTSFVPGHSWPWYK